MPKPAIQILVCVNDRGPDAEKPCCAQRGGLAVYHWLKDEVKRRGLRDEVLVTRTGCLKHCSRGVTVAVWPDNVWYGHVRVEDAAELLDAAAEGSGPVERLLMPPGPWE
jgi:(2Fe-2S) ferredoxin